MQRIKQIAIAIAIATLTSFVVVTAINTNPFLNQLEQGTINYFQSIIPPLEKQSDIILVNLDKESATALGASNPAQDSINRKFHGELIDRLAKAKASVVLVDIIFEERVPEQEAEFFSNLKSAAETSSTAIIMTKEGYEVTSDDKEDDWIGHVFDCDPGLKQFEQKFDFGMALAFHPDALVIGCLASKTDVETDKTIYHTALLTAWRHMRLNPNEAKLHDGRLHLPGWDAQVGFNNEFALQWTNGKNAFKTIPFLTALESLRKGDSAIFKDKIIIIGDTRGSDVVEVPIHGSVPGSLVIANLVNSALAPGSQRLKWFNSDSHHIPVILFSTFMFLAVLSQKRVLQIISLLSPLIIGLLIPISFALIFHVVMPATWPFISTLTTVVIALITLAVQAPQKDTRIAGELSEATVLFSDLTASTEWVQKIGAVEYQHRFGEWLDECEKSIRKFGGHVERTTGDGFIAVFPNPPVVSCPNALKTCQEILANMTQNEFDVSFGFESGPVSGGYLIEAGRKVWSSSGTTVNLAKRLQSEAGKLNELIVFGPIAARFLKETTTVKSLGHHTLKGIEGEIEIFTSTP